MQLQARLLKKALIFSAFFYVLPTTVYAFDCSPQHIDESARVNYVYDGDTLQLEDGRKVRLLGIDTPEIFSRTKKVADDIKFRGEQARAALQKQLSSSKQKISLAYGVQRFDRYKRTLAHVFLPNGKNLQAWLVAQGFAIAHTTPPNDKMSDCYNAQEAQARKQKLGIWAMPQYQLKRTTQLDKTSEGFHRLQAKVSRVLQSPKNITLFLDNTVEIKIYSNDLHNFNSHMLNNLAHKNVQVRGWLHVKKKQKKPQNKTGFIITLRHQDAIKVIH